MDCYAGAVEILNKVHWAGAETKDCVGGRGGVVFRNKIAGVDAVDDDVAE